MPQNNFLQRKKDILSKADKSFAGKWDDKIKKLCDKINSKEKFYTTSSCSGRILVLIDQDEKAPNLFECVSHDIVDFENFMKCLPKEKAKLNLKFKSEPPIIHIACIDLKSASELIEKGKTAGWKRAGVISLGKNIIVEFASTEKIEFPLAKNGKMLVDENFLKIILEKSNENLKKGWKKIEKLMKLI